MCTGKSDARGLLLCETKLDEPGEVELVATARDKDGKTYKDENGYTAKESEFHRVTCFNGLAKTIGQYCSKGQLVSVQGRIHYTQWEDKDGVTRYGTEILADKVDFLSRGNGSADENENTDAPEID